MKKVVLFIAFCLVCVFGHAQIVRVYKGNATTPVFELQDADSVVFLAAQPDPTPEPVPQGVSKMPKSRKRGVAFSFTNAGDMPVLSPSCSWSYNWGNTATSTAALWFDYNDMEYCPMCWNGNYSADNIRAYVQAHPKTKYLLAFNEPNLTDQANLTPQQAAALWPNVKALAAELGLKIVSPAMNYGTLSGYSDPTVWLDAFFSQPGVSLSDVSAISVHCYMSSNSALQNFIELFRKYGKPVWLTEFCAWDPVPGSAEAQMNYMCQALNYLEQESLVERYAWFIPRSNASLTSAPYNQLLSHDLTPELTDLGKIYTRFSSFSSASYLQDSRFIHAGEYVSVSGTSVQVRPSTDSLAATTLGLMVKGLASGTTLTYQVAVTSAVQNFTIRYSGYSNSILQVNVDGRLGNYVSLPRTGNDATFQSATVPVALSVGQHTISFTMFSGSSNLSGFSIH